MGDMTAPGPEPGGDELAQAAAPAPAAPLIAASEQYVGSPFPLQDGARLTLGWQWRGERKGGPVFALLSRNMSGGYKVRETFPLTAGGWAQAWDLLARLSPDDAARAREVLRQRAAADRARQERDGHTPELIALDVESLAVVRGVTLLGGYAPEVDMRVGHQYDIRFREERLAVYRDRRPDLVIEFPYAEIEAVDIGGPGLVSSGIGLPAGGFGAIVTLEGLGAAAVLSSLTARTAIKTVVRVQAAGAELFLLCTQLAPQDLRIYLSRPLGEIRAAHAAAAAPETGGAARVEHLARLASMLESGLLTRAEFDTLKADLLRRP